MEQARISWMEKRSQNEKSVQELSLSKEIQAKDDEQKESTRRLEFMDDCLKQAGYKTLGEYMNDLLSTRDRQLSSKVSQTLLVHGNTILGNISHRQPQLVDNYSFSRVEDVLVREAQAVVALMQPSGLDLASRLQQFSLEQALYQSSLTAPNLHRLLCLLVGHLDGAETTRKKKDVVSVLRLVRFTY